MSSSSPLAIEPAEREQRLAARQRLEQMFNQHHKLIWRTLRRMGLSPEMAADTTQQAFLVAAEKLQAIEQGKERAFLFAVALRQASAARRKAQRYSLDPELDRHEHPGDGAAALSNRHAAMQVVDRVLSGLDEELAVVLVLFELEGLSTPEIAQLLGVPLGTAASRLRRAREKFRAGARRVEGSSEHPS
jgi:RNA polymerase sigma-70 factor (ECF subfamily)